MVDGTANLFTSLVPKGHKRERALSVTSSDGGPCFCRSSQFAVNCLS